MKNDPYRIYEGMLARVYLWLIATCWWRVIVGLLMVFLGRIKLSQLRVYLKDRVLDDYCRKCACCNYVGLKYMRSISQQRATKGDKQAMVTLAYCYAYGVAGPVDEYMAATWYRYAEDGLPWRSL